MLPIYAYTSAPSPMSTDPSASEKHRWVSEPLKSSMPRIEYTETVKTWSEGR